MPEAATIRELPGMIQSQKFCPAKVAERVLHFITTDAPGVTEGHKSGLIACIGRNNTFRLRFLALLKENPDQHLPLIEKLATHIDSSFPLIQDLSKKGFVPSKPKK